MSLSNEINSLYNQIIEQITPVLEYYENDPTIYSQLIPWIRSIPKTERYLNTRRIAEWILEGRQYVIDLSYRLVGDINVYLQERDRLTTELNRGMGDIESVLDEQEKLYQVMNIFTEFLGCSKTTNWYIKLVEMNMETHYDLQYQLESILTELQYLCNYVNRIW